MKIMLMVPPYIDKQTVPGMRFEIKVEDLGLGYIQAYLRAMGYENTTVLHCPIEGIKIEDLRKIFVYEKPDCLGISISFESTDYIGGMRAAEIFKELYPNNKIFVGGQCATFSYRRLMTDCGAIDYVVLSEGEVSVYELIKAIEYNEQVQEVPGIIYRTRNQDIAISRQRELIANLDELPFPCRDTYIKNKPEFALIETSRGCWGKCRFCSVPAFFSFNKGSVWRTRSAGSIIAEIENIIDRWGISSFDFVDDNFIGPGKRGIEKIQEFTNAIVSRGIKMQFNIACRVDSISAESLSLLKKIGLNKVYIGIESGSDMTLKRYGKMVTARDNKRAVEIVKSLNLNAKLNFIMFDPWMTTEELKETLQFIEDIDCYNYIHWSSILNSYKPVLGTEMYDCLSHTYGALNESTYFSYPIVDKRVEHIREMGKIVSATISRVYMILENKSDWHLTEKFKKLDDHLSRYLVRLMLFLIDGNVVDDFLLCQNITYGMLFEMLRRYMGGDIFEKIATIM